MFDAQENCNRNLIFLITNNPSGCFTIMCWKLQFKLYLEPWGLCYKTLQARSLPEKDRFCGRQVTFCLNKTLGEKN